MEAGFIALAVAMTLVGIIVGVRIERVRNRRRDVKGVLNVCRSDPDYGSELFLALGVPVEEVVSQKYVTFAVNVIRNSQK